MSIRIIVGDCRKALAELPDESVQMCVTSPPYYGLRDYKTGEWIGGDEACDHVSHELRTGLGMAKLSEEYKGGGKKASLPKTVQFKDTCGKCGATRIDDQIGLESTPSEYVAEMVGVFREVRRVLKPDGVLWLNLGDTYAGSGGQSPQSGKLFKGRARQRENITRSAWVIAEGLKPKELMGIPWRVAFALQDDGWWLRQDVIWSKTNPMPESVTDRCTKSHEYLFILTKGEQYYSDFEAIAEPAVWAGSGRTSAKAEDLNPNRKRNDRTIGASFRAIRETRNKRSVWTVATVPNKEAHFAMFPPALIEPCILATSRVGDTVLDPFGGAGTTGLVADRYHRHAVLIELNPESADIARRRIAQDGKMFAQVS